MFYVYILHSQKDGKLYTGYTHDLRSRMKAHETKRVVFEMYFRKHKWKI